MSSPARAPRRIPVADPALVGREKEYVLDCLESTWISSSGEYIGRFEETSRSSAASQHAIACCNGTVALHLALLAHGVGPGDEVIVPALTYVATANAVALLRRRRRSSWTPSPRRGTSTRSRSLRRSRRARRAIVAVHLYGHPADMDALARDRDAPRALRGRGRCRGARRAATGAVASARSATRGLQLLRQQDHHDRRGRHGRHGRRRARRARPSASRPGPGSASAATGSRSSASTTG